MAYRGLGQTSVQPRTSLALPILKPKVVLKRKNTKQIPSLSHPIQNPHNRNSKRKVLNFVNFFFFFLSLKKKKKKKVNKKLCLVHSVNPNFKQKWPLIVTALYSLVLVSQIALRKMVKTKRNDACLLHRIGLIFWWGGGCSVKQLGVVSWPQPSFWAVGGVQKCCS